MCQAATPTNTSEPLQRTELPEKKWHEVSVDHVGPFPDGKYVRVTIDNCSRFPIVEVAKFTSTQETFNNLTSIFPFSEHQV